MISLKSPRRIWSESRRFKSAAPSIEALGCRTFSQPKAEETKNASQTPRPTNDDGGGHFLPQCAFNMRKCCADAKNRATPSPAPWRALPGARRQTRAVCALVECGRQKAGGRRQSMHLFDFCYWRPHSTSPELRSVDRCPKKKKKKKKDFARAAASRRHICAPAKNRKRPRCATPIQHCFAIHLPPCAQKKIWLRPGKCPFVSFLVKKMSICVLHSLQVCFL
jgi:hypothetical protein